MNYIDLTHNLNLKTPTFDGESGFKLSIQTDYNDCVPPNVFRTQKIISPAGIGTHMDAPAHCIEGGRTIDELTLEELVADCVVINVAGNVDENFVIQPGLVEQFETQYGVIRPKTVAIFYTGWSRYWEDPSRYRNNLRFPSVGESAAQLLLQRGIAGLGIDTLSADAGGQDYPVHRAILGANKFLIENIAHADKLPPTGAKIFVLPVKIEGGTEAPLRLIAVI